MATYVNDLRLTELATGEGSGTWGVTTNTNLELIGEALGYGTQDCFASDADSTTTVADGASDPARAMYFKVTSSATLTATRTLTIAPNTVSRVMLIENATTGSQSIAISQGSGGNVTIASGQVKMVYLDGAGATAAVVDALADLELGTITVADLTATTADINGGTIDGVTIGGSSAGAITGTTGQFNTSLNVDGTVTADGLTVDGNAVLSSASSPSLTITDTTNTCSTILKSFNTTAVVGTTSNHNFLIYANNLPVANFAAGGDISFYEDTGTTPKFFWDASAEALGIGTSSPATALDVAGTVTADGLTVDGSATIQATSSPALIVKDTTNNAEARLQAFNSTATVGTQSNHSFSIETNDTNRALFSSGGDISFYEDTGTTPKFFWDASAERLGIGTSSPVRALHVESSSNLVGRFSSSATEGFIQLAGSGTGTAPRVGATGNNFVAYTSDTERMRITSAGDVGIGTTSPAALFHADVSGTLPSIAASTVGLFSRSATCDVSIIAGSTNLARVNFGDNSNEDVGQVAYSNNDDSMRFTTNSAEAMRIDASGNVGIGCTPSVSLEVEASSNATFRVKNTTDSTATLQLTNTGSSNGKITQNSGNMAFSISASEAMRIDSSGNLLVGTTDTNPANNSDGSTGFAIKPTGELLIASDENVVCYMNRQGTDGDIAVFRKDGTTVGSIGVYVSDRLYISDNNDCGLQFDATLIRPCDSSGANNDNAIDLGSSGSRFNDAYITNGVTTGSDGRDKQDIAELDEAERRVAVAAKSLLRKWRWKDAVAKKGDDARIHFGIIAQDLKAAFEAEGLDAGRYGMFMYDEWTDEETGEERSRMGVRYSELLAFIIAAL